MSHFRAAIPFLSAPEEHQNKSLRPIISQIFHFGAPYKCPKIWQFNFFNLYFNSLNIKISHGIGIAFPFISESLNELPRRATFPDEQK